MTTPPTAAEAAAMIDHTLLKPEATAADVESLIADAIELGTYSVCVSPSMLPIGIPAGSNLKVAAVCGFPSGKHSSAVKAAEAAEAVRHGADEIDMVIDIGAAKAGDFDCIAADIAAVRAAAPAPTVLKVIIESAALTDEEIIGACRAAVAAGADFVKTSTGFHPSGGGDGACGRADAPHGSRQRSGGEGVRRCAHPRAGPSHDRGGSDTAGSIRLTRTARLSRARGRTGLLTHCCPASPTKAAPVVIPGRLFVGSVTDAGYRSAVLDQQRDADDRYHPDAGHEQCQPVEVLLDHRGAGQAGLDTATEQGGQTTTFGTMQQDQEHDQHAGHDQSDLQSQFHG